MCVWMNVTHTPAKHTHLISSELLSQMLMFNYIYSVSPSSNQAKKCHNEDGGLCNNVPKFVSWCAGNACVHMKASTLVIPWKAYQFVVQCTIGKISLLNHVWLKDEFAVDEHEVAISHQEHNELRLIQRFNTLINWKAEWTLVVKQPWEQENKKPFPKNKPWKQSETSILTVWKGMRRIKKWRCKPVLFSLPFVEWIERLWSRIMS